MKVGIYGQEWYPVFEFRDKEHDFSMMFDIDEELIKEYNKKMEEFEEVRNRLEDIIDKQYKERVDKK